MASKSLLFVGLLFAVILIISSDLVSARAAAETKGDVKVDELPDQHHGGHHNCHHPHCRDKDETNPHEEAEAKPETTKSNEAKDNHDHHKCKDWPHC